MKEELKKEGLPGSSRAANLKKLNALKAFALDAGASGASVMDTDRIVTREQVRLKCRVPLCNSYNRNLMCPPNVMELDEFGKVLKCYSKALLVQKEGRVEPGQERDRAVIFKPANELHQLVNDVEREAYRMGFRFAAGFIGGSCKLCDECVTVGSGLPCKYPFKARPSMEAMGIDVFDTALEAGLPFSISMGDSVVWCGLILVY
jgi:predicted metal-binding protein